jgi:hypothetical protein
VAKETLELKFCDTKLFKALNVMSGKGCWEDDAATVGKHRRKTRRIPNREAKRNQAKAKICWARFTRGLHMIRSVTFQKHIFYIPKPTSCEI